MQPVSDKKEYKYRIVRKTYRDGAESEDGPGSLTNVVSRSTESVLWEQVIDHSVSIEEIPAVKTYPNDNFTDTLELYNDETSDWEFVGHVKHNYVNDDGSQEEDIEECAQDYLEDYLENQREEEFFRKDFNLEYHERNEE